MRYKIRTEIQIIEDGDALVAGLHTFQFAHLNFDALVQLRAYDEGIGFSWSNRPLRPRPDTVPQNTRHSSYRAAQKADSETVSHNVVRRCKCSHLCICETVTCAVDGALLCPQILYITSFSGESRELVTLFKTMADHHTDQETGRERFFDLQRAVIFCLVNQVKGGYRSKSR